MGIPPRPSTLAIQTEGEVSAIASLVVDGHAAELTVWGKLVFALGHEGELTLVGAPEAPGYNHGAPDPGELDPGSARRIIVRGARNLGGRAILRRGPTALGQVEFGPGAETMSASLVANTMQTTIAGRRGDEWLVVEGVEGPQARRWCKLPKLGVTATWSDPSALGGPTSIPALDRLLLTSRLCFVDVSSWTISFVMRGARKLLARMAPTSVTVAIQDLGNESMPGGVLGRRVPLPPVSPLPLPSMPTPRASAHDFDSGPTVMSRKDEPLRKGFMDDDTTTGIHLTTEDFIESTVSSDVPKELNAPTRIRSPEETARILSEIADEKTAASPVKPPPPPPPKRSTSSSGFRLGPPSVKSEGKPEIVDETSVSRAFAALTAPPDPDAKPRSPREEQTLVSAVNPKESPVVKKRS